MDADDDLKRSLSDELFDLDCKRQKLLIDDDSSSSSSRVSICEAPHTRDNNDDSSSLISLVSFCEVPHTRDNNDAAPVGDLGVEVASGLRSPSALVAANGDQSVAIVNPIGGEITSDLEKELIGSNEEVYPCEIIDGIENLSGQDIPNEIWDLLSLGPAFCPPGNFTIREGFEGGILLQHKALYNCDDPRWYYIHKVSFLTGALFAEMKSNAFTRIAKQNAILCAMYIHTNYYFMNNPGVLVAPNVSGVKSVLLTCGCYERKMGAAIDLLVTNSIYAPVETDFETERELIRSKFLKLRAVLLKPYIFGSAAKEKPDYLSSELLNKLHNCVDDDIHLPHFHGVVDTREVNKVLIPMCSCLDWYTYPLLKMAREILDRLFQDRFRHKVNKLDEFVHQLGSVPLGTGYVFVKVSVVDMGINVYDNKILRWLQTVLPRPQYETMFGLDRDTFFECLDFCFNHANYAQYNEHILRQTRSLPQENCDSSAFSLGSILLDLFMETLSETMFSAFGIAEYWRSGDDVLVYVCETAAEAFVRQFEEVTAFKIKVEREMCGTESSHGGLCSTEKVITFADLVIVAAENGLRCAQFKQPREPKRVTHFFATGGFSSKKEELRRSVLTVLQTTSNVFLKDDLLFVENQFYMHRYPKMLVATVFRAEVDGHLNWLALDLEAANLRLRVLGEAEERRTILGAYMTTFANVLSGQNPSHE